MAFAILLDILDIYLLMTLKFKICRTVRSAVDCTLLQSDIDSIRGWYAANCMTHNIDKTPVITFTR
jgi:hypothetical protein